MWLADGWSSYEVLDTRDGDKLERWGDIILSRPDPQVIWKEPANAALWNTAHAHYERSSSGGGSWEYFKKLPERWSISYNELKFFIKPLGFKHTGLFPEQAVNWNYIIDKIQNAKREIRVLNLFAYTGGATVAAAFGGAAETVHVDAAKAMVAWAKDNVEGSGLGDKKVRFIVDDVLKFVAREKRRGRQYDAIIMDPPSYGRGPNGEVWKLEDELYGLISECMGILSDKPLFFIVNSYTTGLSPTVLTNILSMTLKKRFGGRAYADEIGLPITQSGLILPCGSTGRWEEE